MEAATLLADPEDDAIPSLFVLQPSESCRYELLQ
jgi:hypothetical protein